MFKNSLVYILLAIALLQYIVSCVAEVVYKDSKAIQESDRSGRLASFKVPPTPCGVGNSGVCYPKKICSGTGRKKIAGSCENFGIATCCQFNFTSSMEGEAIIISEKVSTIQSNEKIKWSMFEFPKIDQYCQLKLDFLEFGLDDPDESGDCVEDKLLLSGSSTVSDFVLCGSKVPTRAFYLSYGEEKRITVEIITGTTGRKFKIKATQIHCMSADRVNERCLVQYPAGSGNVMSFGYPDYQINGQEYSVCVGDLSSTNSRQIQWRMCNLPEAEEVQKPGAFFLSNYFGLQAGGFGHDTCTRTSYVALYGREKYCGAYFPPQTEGGWPNILSVRFVPDSASNFVGSFSTLISTQVSPVMPEDTIFGKCDKLPLGDPNVYTCETDLNPSTPPTPPERYGFCLTYVGASRS